LIRTELRLAEKYPDNTTIVHIDENGNSESNIIFLPPERTDIPASLTLTLVLLTLFFRNSVVYGLKLDQIPKGDLKIIINAHGTLGKIKNRSVERIAKYISIINSCIIWIFFCQS
jgi:hypothetical protein